MTDNKIYYITGFRGYWPVGTAAIMIARSPEEAKALLENELAERDIELKQEIRIDQIKQIDPARSIQAAIILNDGNY